ncbi:hypothetical protein DOY81_002256, partial [Sarcophaga bullata]
VYLQKLNVYGNPDALSMTCVPPPKNTDLPLDYNDIDVEDSSM